jgi:hypothetical protein
MYMFNSSKIYVYVQDMLLYFPQLSMLSVPFLRHGGYFTVLILHNQSIKAFAIDLKWNGLSQYNVVH